jgi:hypothetical protein
LEDLMPTPEEKKQTDEPLDMLLADAATELRAIDCESLALAVEEARRFASDWRILEEDVHVVGYPQAKSE